MREGRIAANGLVPNAPWSNFDPRGSAFAVSRTIIALAQLSILIFTPPFQLFQPVLGEASYPHCAGARIATAYCLADSVGGVWIGHVVCGAVLLLVISGYFPRISAVLHFWVSISLGLDLAVPDGGEAVARFATFFLLLIAMTDRRRNHWVAAASSQSLKIKGYTFAVWWAARIQIAFIYFYSAAAKVNVDRWLDGTAIYYFVRDPQFGASEIFAPIAETATRNPVLVAAITWCGIGFQFIIAILVLRGSRSRAIALGMDTLLHLGIVMLLGLWSFSLIMIGYAVFCCGQTTEFDRPLSIPKGLRSQQMALAPQAVLNREGT